MAANEDGTLTAAESCVFISESSELQSLSSGIFASESLPSGEEAANMEQENSDGLTAETELESFCSATESGVQMGLLADTAEETSNVDTNLDNPHPLGSSLNPIRIIQQGNKYTSMQELSSDQLGQIMQVIQQQQLLQTNQPSIIFNPETQTKIIYRVVYPSDIHASKPTRGRKRTYHSPDDISVPDQPPQSKAKKLWHRRTRSGRVCRPPQYMVKDYKQMPTVEFEVEAGGDTGARDLDSRDSSGDEENGDGQAQKKGGGVLGFEEEIPIASSGKPKSFKCATCEKRYVGHCGLARHYRIHPTHGSAEDLLPAVNASAEQGSSNDSLSANPTHTPTAPIDTHNTAASTEIRTIPPSTIEELTSTPAAVAPSSDMTHGTKPTTSSEGPVKRKRGRPPLFSQQAVQRRQQKLIFLMQQCTTADVMEVVLPHLASSLSVWQYLFACAEAKSSSSTVNSPAAVPDNVAMRNIDLGFMLDQYSALHKCLKSFCKERLEKQIDISADDDFKASEKHSSEKDLSHSPKHNTLQASDDVGASVHNNNGSETVDNRDEPRTEIQLTENESATRLNQISLETIVSGPGTKMLSATQHGWEKTDDGGNNPCRVNDPFTETALNTDSATHGNYSADVSSLNVNGDDPPDAILPPGDRNTAKVSESHEMITAGNSETENLNGNPNPETENTHKSDNSFCTASEINSGMSENDGILMSLNKKSDDSVFGQSDSCKLGSSTVAMDNIDSGAIDGAEKARSVETAMESCHNGMANNAKNTQAVSDVQTLCSDETGDTLPMTVKVVNNTLEVSSVELAHCLGLSAHTRYCIKQEDKHETTPKVTSAKTPTSSAVSTNTTAEKAMDSIVFDSVPISMLPPRKRLKASHAEHSIGNTDVSVAEVDKSSCAEERYDGVDFCTLLESEQFSSSPGFVSGSGSIALASSSGVVAVENLNSAEKNPLAALSTPPHLIRQESAQSGRKPRPKKSSPANPETIWTVRNDSGDFGVVPPPTSMVAVPTPDVIQIPEDARVFQTEDGMVIVVQSDGTVQIHGHTEGQPIPIDTIRRLLGMDETWNHTPFDQNLQELTQYNQSVPVSTAYETLNQISSSEAVPVDAPQPVLMDRIQPLMAYDPITQSVVQIDPRQTFITLTDNSTVLAMDGTQSGIVGSSALAVFLEK